MFERGAERGSGEKNRVVGQMEREEKGLIAAK
jgi:hypothetical protein